MNYYIKLKVCISPETPVKHKVITIRHDGDDQRRNWRSQFRPHYRILHNELGITVEYGFVDVVEPLEYAEDLSPEQAAKRIRELHEALKAKTLLVGQPADKQVH